MAFHGPSRDRRDTSEASSGASRPMDISAAAHIAQFQDFASAVQDNRPPAVSGEDGRLSIELVEAIYRSAWKNAA